MKKPILWYIRETFILWEDHIHIKVLIKELLQYLIKTFLEWATNLESIFHIMERLAILRDSEYIILLIILQNRLSTLMYIISVSYTHLRAHETVLDLVCRLLLEKK